MRDRRRKLLARRSVHQAKLARAVLERTNESLIERWPTLKRWLIGVNWTDEVEWGRPGETG
ncbi:MULTISPECIES: hypothetical protein [Sorangium]|uniref:Transposase n=1 Tax=Sorangium cellulosum TaxID=56 RepID=A0A4P2QM58_SORCE|nr:MULTISPECIES: hypothetical protein [Sorangium]AUX30593.1 uncharacterized protein SOCE836_027020 [Sorangium cellulosum]WCQ89987.1 hypothetical protein NQZ70_02686 [Sorangium sp. Soce836]